MPETLIRPLTDFHGQYANTLFKRWWIRPTDIAREAGVSQHQLSLWLKGRIPSARFEGRGAVYDATLTALVRQARWAAQEALNLRVAYDQRLAAVAERQEAG